MFVPPRHHTPRSDLPTHGWRAAKVASAKGRPFMPWQRDAVDVALEYDPDNVCDRCPPGRCPGLPRYGIVVVSVPRQAGKTDLEGSVGDQYCLWNKRARVRITMQDGKTADEWMREQHFISLEESFFRGRYEESRRAGAHGVGWKHNGSTFTTFPPIRKALHSKQSDIVFVDEAWAHPADVGRDLKQAIRPTMNTRPHSQLWIVSTRGDETSEYLDEYIARGLASLDDPTSRVCFIDYGLADGDDPEDLQAVAARHPAIGRTITLSSLSDAQLEFVDPATGVLDVASWARAYGNLGSRTRETVFPASVWADAGRIRQPLPARVGLGLDVSPDGRLAALAAGWRDPDGHGYVELIHVGPVTRDLPQLLGKVARARKVPIHVDRQAQAALEVTDAFAQLDPRDRPEVEFLSTAQYGSACATFKRDIFAGTAHHFNDPDLDAAVEVLGERNLQEGGIGWSRVGSSGAIPPVVSSTIALRAFEQLPPERRPARALVARA